MNRAFAIYMFLLCLQTLIFANYARIPKRLLKLSAQEEKSKRFIRKVPIRTKPGTLPVQAMPNLPARPELPPDSLASPNTQIVSEVLAISPDLHSRQEAHSNAKAFSAIPSDLTSKSKTQVLPEHKTQDLQIDSKLLTDELPIFAQIFSETSPLILHQENIKPTSNRNLLPGHMLFEIQGLPINNTNPTNIVSILKSQPIVKYTLPEMKILPILTTLPVLTSLPKVNLMPRVKPQADAVPIMDFLTHAVDFEESMPIAESLTIDMKKFQEVKFEIIEPKPNKSPILHKAMKIEEMKRNLYSVDRQENNKNNGGNRNMDFKDYFRRV